MRADPRDCGARCGECPLGPTGVLRKDKDDDWSPVGPELHPQAKVLAVAESPGPEDVQYGRPLMGRAGGAWAAALAAAARSRVEVDLVTVIGCQPPGQPSGAWSRMTKKLDQMNKARAKKGQESIPHPMTCCRPRLLKIAEQYANIITLGRVATMALTGRNQSIQAARGGPIWVDEDWGIASEETQWRRVFPMLHPSFVLRAPAWRHVLHADVGKAFRWFNDELRWVDPDIVWRPSPQELKDFLAQPAPYWTYDVETDGISAMECGLRTIAIAIPDLDSENRVAKPESGRDVQQVSQSIGITLKTVKGAPWYEPDDEAAIKDILRTAFTDGRTWVGHNAGYFDRMVIECHLGITVAPLVDTLFLARFRAPDLPKGLKTVGSILTDVERWETTEKGDKISTGAQGDDELLRYNCIDAVVNARIVPPLVEATEWSGAFRDLPEWARPAGWGAHPWNLNEVDHATQDMCVRMHQAGIWVDQRTRMDLQIHFELSVKKRLAHLQSLVAPDFNPGSADQVRHLFYSVWNLGVPAQMDTREFYTESGLPGTGDAVLRAHLASGNLSADQQAMVKELRLYRRERNKILGTVLLPMQRRDVNEKKGLVRDDGRVRSNWNAHVTSVGRLSSSGPNLQNIGNRKGQGQLKSIFAAPPGRIFIGADLDQAHLRITASYWQIPRLLECFAEGKDPHNLLAQDIFGDKFSSADGWGPEGFSLERKPTKGAAKSMRDIVKTFRYASIYWADPSTVWQVLTSTETDDGKLPYLGFDVREVRYFHEQWLKAEPEWLSAWSDMLDLYRRQHFMEEPVLGRRSGPLSDGKKNEVVNYPILAAESSLMRIAEHAVMEAFPYDFGGPGTGMIHQCHDSVCVEAPLPEGLPPDWRPVKGEPLPRKIEEMRRQVEEAMTIHVPQWSVPLTAEADVGRTLKDV